MQKNIKNLLAFFLAFSVVMQTEPSSISLIWDAHT